MIEILFKSTLYNTDRCCLVADVGVTMKVAVIISVCVVLMILVTLAVGAYLSPSLSDTDNITNYTHLLSVAVSGVGLINEVNRHWARLVLGWVTVCGRVNH